MFISIIGTRASGKSSVQQFLVSRLQFQPVQLRRDNFDSQTSHHKQLSSTVPQSGEADGNANGTLLPSIYFDTPTDLLDYVTKHWRESFVTCDLETPQLIYQLNQRPFFLLVSVDAPMLTRYRRLINCAAPNLTLQEFVDDHDAMLYGSQTNPDGMVDRTEHSSLYDLFRLAKVHVINPFQNLTDLHDRLAELNLTDPDRLRPRWDTYFMTLAELASQRSNCMKRRVGAILVRDNRIVATGYNGTPRNVLNCNEGGCQRCNSGGRSGEALDSCLCLHAEENALMEAGRERVGAGSVLYCNTCPCLGCAIKIVQTGVREVVYNLSYKVDDRSAALFNQAGVVLRQHSPR